MGVHEGVKKLCGKFCKKILSFPIYMVNATAEAELGRGGR
jgi:hypothetical protein